MAMEGGAVDLGSGRSWWTQPSVQLMAAARTALMCSGSLDPWTTNLPQPGEGLFVGWMGEGCAADPEDDYGVGVGIRHGLEALHLAAIGLGVWCASS